MKESNTILSVTPLVYLFLKRQVAFNRKQKIILITDNLLKVSSERISVAGIQAQLILARSWCFNRR